MTKYFPFCNRSVVKNEIKLIFDMFWREFHLSNCIVVGWLWVPTKESYFLKSVVESHALPTPQPCWKHDWHLDTICFRIFDINWMWTVMAKWVEKGKIWKIEEFSRLVINSTKSICRKFNFQLTTCTVWKFQDFTVTPIFREIDFAIY